MNLEEAVKRLKNNIKTTREALKTRSYHGERFNIEQDCEAIDTVLNELDNRNEKINQIKDRLEEHIKFCEQEASGHLDNNVCHISLKFCKRLLELLNKE